jgi:hypothetical protein
MPLDSVVGISTHPCPTNAHVFVEVKVSMFELGAMLAPLEVDRRGAHLWWWHPWKLTMGLENVIDEKEKAESCGDNGGVLECRKQRCWQRGPVEETRRGSEKRLDDIIC